MSKTLIRLAILGFFAIFAAETLAQTPPSEAQIKKDLMNPGVIAI